MPRVTVIIPTFNYSQVLPWSIGSTLRQNFGDFELLVIGDCCTDDSEAVVRAIGDPRVRWINLEKNVGHQSGPNNEGIRQARGEFIAYLGHDDLWLPHHLELAVKNLDGGAALSYGLTEMVLPDEASPAFAPAELEYSPGIWIPPTGVVHRRDAIEKVGPWKHFLEMTDKEPEQELWDRMHGSGLEIKAVRRLTAVKFPATARKNVYGEKPNREQQAFTQRIQSEPEFEATEMGKMLAPRQEARKTFSQSLRSFTADTWGRIRYRLRRFDPMGPKRLTKAELYEARLKFRGVERPKS